jgi:hypothetical protein
MRFDLPEAAPPDWVQLALAEYRDAVKIELEQRKLDEKKDHTVLPPHMRPLRPLSSSAVEALQSKLDGDIRVWAAEVVRHCPLS